MVSNPAQLKLEDGALVICQEKGAARVMLEDISVVLLDTPQVSITSAALSACMDAKVAVITVDQKHLPNGVLVPFQGYSRPLRMLKAQVALGLPVRKRLWQYIVRRKIANQSSVLTRSGNVAEGQRLAVLVSRVRSGDPDNVEARAAQTYFRSLFGQGFTRAQARLANGALDYGYAVFRAAIARSLTARSFAPALGLFHRNELNAYNLADDLLEPYRPIVDEWAVESLAGEAERELLPADKQALVKLLHQDVAVTTGSENLGVRTVLSAMEASAAALGSVILGERGPGALVLPDLAVPLIDDAGAGGAA